ncbi:hypothetical protein IPV08_19130 [Methylobacterium sp. SD274]|uniref:Uncharacterized protein n=1 Tax=Methylobacterium gossipiicola TaxID=582675 RepID=A0A1I2UZQ5_9HYPH|nr:MULTISPECIES: hypothetical protein [Methylobacterium]KQO66531.1 hypothetical protein ASF18_13745 [Methylobacterium sp. Leaf89]MBO1022074.1 hypothetical protein [Methylobacterium sp. SD274]SFG82373.1 hypothetical protein SAMN05192565_112102 [Methylobacterium gossipiicola]
MIASEFLTIAGRALRDHCGADSVTVRAIEPTVHGPRVRWDGPLLHRERRRDTIPGGGVWIGPPAGPLLLNILSLATAFRWADGAPRCAKDWSERLARRYRRVFGPTGPATGPGWSWLWEAGAQAVKDAGIPSDFRTSDAKEKYGSARWYVEGDTSAAVDDVIDAVEHLSAHICEDCGAPGRIRQGGWLRCLCTRHAEGRLPTDE